MVLQALHTNDAEDERCNIAVSDLLNEIQNQFSRL